ncbi:MAG: flagellar export chaperone FliS [Nitrospinae bacterium CG11_big_fil_rev_8_21_14_0_20_56_8]|nr:MAG: flagellar export chaperone FliS [Nitrospinae bacterium CG11_big_fil_rev_8_21_14_0_20_56_8]
MVPAKFHNQYRQNQISTSSQGKLILMMYEGAIRFSKMAIAGMTEGDLSKKGLYIQKTHDIVNELSLALNMEKGGEVARKLESLYQFILRQLTLANIKSDKKALESVVRVLTPLYEAWNQLLSVTETPEEPPQQPGKVKPFVSRC